MENKKQSHIEKTTLHPRNKHTLRYDFKVLTQSVKALEKFIILNKYGSETIDFADPEAVKLLNSALLKHFYQIDFWDIPDGYLCPPIPGRADYIHYAADLLASCDHQKIPKGKKIKVLDVGIGANCVYPIIGHQEYGWQFVGSEIDDIAIKAANAIVNVNHTLKNAVEIRMQKSKQAVFNTIIHQQECFDLTICNPPFHASAAEANESAKRKVRNLGKSNATKPVLNFGGQKSELWIEGGEIGFIGKMIEESKLFKSQCFWFTTLVSKRENIAAISAMLTRAGAVDTRMSEMATGNKLTRIIGWTFLNAVQQEEWVKKWV